MDQRVPSEAARLRERPVAHEALVWFLRRRASSGVSARFLVGAGDEQAVGTFRCLVIRNSEHHRVRGRQGSKLEVWFLQLYVVFTKVE